MSRSSAPAPDAGLSIGAVSARTGLSVPVLRAWEHRHGFPRPARLVGGHRRYDDAEVDRILQVAQARREGRSIEAAIALVVGSSIGPEVGDDPGEGTMGAALRRRRPDLPVQVLTRRAMLGLSHAIEDECLAQAEHPHVTAAFQHRAAYVRARPRWQHLTRVAASAVVFADFRRSWSRGTVHQIAIPEGSPMAGEWSVVCDGPASAALLAGWERPDGAFEAVWSLDPDVVRLGTQIARSIAGRLAPRLEVPPAPTAGLDPGSALRRATAVTNRALAYVAR